MTPIVRTLTSKLFDSSARANGEGLLCLTLENTGNRSSTKLFQPL
jgi:hypothetical protein